MSNAGILCDGVGRQIQLTVDTIKKRNDLFRNGLQFSSFKSNIIILDDGLASCYTMLSAVGFVKRHVPQKGVVAVLTCSRKTVDLFCFKLMNVSVSI